MICPSSQIVVATVALGAAATLALPVTSQEGRDIVGRNNRQFWSDFRSGFKTGFEDTMHVAGEVIPLANGYKTLLVRNDDSALNEIIAREGGLSQREPKNSQFWSDFSGGFKTGFEGTMHAAQEFLPIATGIKTLVGRSYEDSLDELVARDEGLSQRELDTRTFWADFKGGFKKGFTGTLKTGLEVAPIFLREELSQRDVYGREILALEELD